jgi:hypothetical protein
MSCSGAIDLKPHLPHSVHDFDISNQKDSVMHDAWVCDTLNMLSPIFLIIKSCTSFGMNVFFKRLIPDELTRILPGYLAASMF